MPRGHYIQTNFTAGELSPLIDGRVDIEKYKNGCSLLKNMVIIPQGGVTGRGGFHYVDETKYHNKRSRLIPFEFSSVQAYVLEFGDLYIRVIMNGYVVRVLSGVELVVNGTFDADIANWDNLSAAPGYIQWHAGSQSLQVGRAGGAGGQGHAEQEVTVTDNKLYQLRFDVANRACKVQVGSVSGGDDLVPKTEHAVGAAYEVNFQADGTSAFVQFIFDEGVPDFTLIDNVSVQERIPYEIVTPYTEAQLPLIKYAQSQNILFLVHPDHAPRQLVRGTSHTDWTLELGPLHDGPYMDQNEDQTWTIDPSAVTGNITLTASDDLFYAGHVGSLWRLKNGGNWSWVKVYQVNSATEALATVMGADLTNHDPTWEWCEGLWSDYRGQPCAITFHENRLVMGGHWTEAQKLAASKVAQPFTFAPGTEANDSYVYKVGGGRVDYIRWLVSGNDAMVIGTSGDEFRARGGTDEPITPSNINVKSATTYGVATPQPIRIGSAILFVQKAKRKIREFVYSWQDDAYSAPDMTILGEHLTFYGVREMAYQQEPWSIVWTVTLQDILLGLTYDRLNKIVGWHQHETQGAIESACVIPNETILEDQLYVIANRTIGGSTKRYIEYHDPYAYTDSCLTYSGTAATTFEGADHLAGKTCQVVGDGAVYPDVVIAGDGSFTLDGPAAEEVEVGLGFNRKMTTMRPELTVSGNTSQGVIKRWSTIWIRVFETVGATVNGQLIEFRTPDDPMDEGVPVHTGDFRVTSLGRSRDARVTVEQTQPLPITLVCLFGTVDVGD